MKGTAELNLSLAGTIDFTFAPPEPAPQGKVIAKLMFDGGVTVTGDGDMDTQIPEGKQIKIEVDPRDVSGNAAPIDGNVTWSTEDQTLLQVVPDVASPNQRQAWIQNAVGGALGDCDITATGDADMGTPVRQFSKLLAFQAVAGEAVAFGVNQIGGLEDIPTP